MTDEDAWLCIECGKGLVQCSADYKAGGPWCCEGCHHKPVKLGAPVPDGWAPHGDGCEDCR